MRRDANTTRRFYARIERELAQKEEGVGISETTKVLTMLGVFALLLALFLFTGCTVQQPVKPPPPPVVTAPVPVQEVAAPVAEGPAPVPVPPVVEAPPIRQPDRRNIITKSAATFAFDPDHEYALACPIGELLTIRLVPGEIYQNYASANSEMWMVDSLMSSVEGEPSTVLVIKRGPEAPAIRLVVVTDKNIYRLKLQPSGRGENQGVRFVRFRDPEAEIRREERQLAAIERRKQRAVEPRFPRLDAATIRTYQVRGGPVPWQPVRVTGDHRHTLVFLPANTGAELPILSVMRGDIETRVNSRVVPGEDGAPVIIADEAFNEATLLGQGGTITILRGN